MKSTLLTAAAFFASSALSLPSPLVERQSTNIDDIVLQFALTLEHLENVFYKQALQKFSLRDFQNAGYSADYYNNLKYIAYDEEQHVKLLQGALQADGVTPNEACTYNFPYNSVQSFVTLSSILEGVGTSAYLGGAPLITSKDYLTVAGSILVTEALHTSMQRLAAAEVPMANPYGTPLDPTAVYTLAAAFIVSCPAGNAALPFTPFPSLSVDAMVCTCEEPNCGDPSKFVKRDSHSKKSKNSWKWKWDSIKSPRCTAPVAGNVVKFLPSAPIPAGSYLTFVSGLSVVSVPGNIQNGEISAAIPSTAQGQTYVFVTSSDVEGTFDDGAVLFGPAVLEVKPAAPLIDFTQS